MTSQSEDDSCMSADDSAPKKIQTRRKSIIAARPVSQFGRRDRPAVPFSPRHHEMNKIRGSGTGFPSMAKDSDSARESQSGDDEDDEDNSDTENGSFKRTIDQQSQQAYKRIKRIATATENITEMARGVRRTNASGIIKSIKLYNFMCHKSFYQEWHENLNFVVGENGSGKSALLSGLIIGLGGRALSTARTNSVKELIKTGETHAKTEVVLLNRGKLPVEEYGDQITVQRIIDLKGHSTYKIQCGPNRKFKPSTKIELDNLLRLLDIQLENPVVILNQEYARSFLRTKDPKDKYKLFEDGVGTAQCDAMRAQVSETLRDIDKHLKAKQEEFNKLEKDYTDAKEKVKLIEGMSSHQEKLDGLNRELMWHEVQVAEGKENQAQEDLAKREESVRSAAAHYETSLDKKRKAETDTQPNSEEQKERSRRKQELLRKKEELYLQIRQLEKDKAGAQSRLRAAEMGIPKNKQTIAKLEHKLKNEEQKAQNDREVLLQKYLEDKESLEAQIREVKEEIERMEAEKGRFQEGLRSVRDQITKTNSHRDDLENHIRTKQTQLRKLESSSSSVAVFGQQMERLVEKLSQPSVQNRFSATPRGPLGALVTVRDANYIDIVQYVLRNVMSDFVVNSQEDARLLNGYIKHCFTGNSRPPSVHVIRFRDAYDVSQTNCSKGFSYPSILDMLEFDRNDHIVMNTLLEITSIERILLFKNNDEGLALLSSRETAPRNCRMGYSLDFYKITPDPNLRCDAIQRRTNTPKILKTSHAQHKRNLQIELETLTEELNSLVVSPETTEEERKFNHEVKRLDELCRSKRVEKNQLTHDLHNLKEPPNRMADLASIREELEDRIREKDNMEEEMEVHRAAVEEKVAALKEKNDEKHNLQADIDRLSRDIMKAVESQEKKREEVAALERFAEKFKRKMDQAAEEVKTAERKLGEAKERVKQLKMDALKFGERIEVTRASAEIKKEHDQIKAKIEHLSRFAERNQNIRERYKDLKQRYTKYKKDFKIVKEMFNRVKKYFVQVNQHYLLARDNVCSALKSCYEAVAASRKYHGKIEIDHQTRELFYLICPDKESLEKIEQHSEGSKHKTKMVEYAAGLSGGERSFSTICFIIAMWQAMKSPFYMLDEFDVFMDAQNRKVSQDALMTHAKEFPNNQFFFFTPLDLTKVPSASEALILRLYPPERNANEEVLPSIDPEPELPVGPNRKRGRTDSEQAGPSKSRRV